MKFQYLGIGQAFLYKGERYVKDGPMMALHPGSGKKVLIPRSATLEPVDAAASPTPSSGSATIETTALYQALNGYEQTLNESLQALLPESARPQLHDALQQARLILLRQLGL